MPSKRRSTSASRPGELYGQFQFIQMAIDKSVFLIWSDFHDFYATFRSPAHCSLGHVGLGESVVENKTRNTLIAGLTTLTLAVGGMGLPSAADARGGGHGGGGHGGSHMGGGHMGGGHFGGGGYGRGGHRFAGRGGYRRGYGGYGYGSGYGYGYGGCDPYYGCGYGPGIVGGVIGGLLGGGL
jgi:hypothetical protein